MTTGNEKPPGGDEFAATTLDRPAFDIEIPSGPPPSSFGAPPPAGPPRVAPPPMRAPAAPSAPMAPSSAPENNFAATTLDRPAFTGAIAPGPRGQAPRGAPPAASDAGLKLALIGLVGVIVLVLIGLLVAAVVTTGDDRPRPDDQHQSR